MAQDFSKYTTNSRPHSAYNSYLEAQKKAMAMPTADMLKSHELARAKHLQGLGVYNPVTGSWLMNPSVAEPAGPKDHSLFYRRERRNVDPPSQQPLDPILQTDGTARPATAASDLYAAQDKMSATRRKDPGWHHDHDRGRSRPATVDLIGDYDPVLGQWRAPPTDDKREDRERSYYKNYGSTRRHVAHFTHSKRMGVYDPVKNVWIIPPTDKRIFNGHTIAPRS